MLLLFDISFSLRPVVPAPALDSSPYTTRLSARKVTHFLLTEQNDLNC